MISSIPLHPFHGGIHPPENKQQSTHCPIQPLALPQELVLPLRQHSGAPAKPCVDVGATVLKGQQIAQASGARSVPLHAPTSGIISAIEPRPIAHSSGLTELCMVLSVDGKEQWQTKTPLFTVGQTLSHFSKHQVIEHIQAAGIVGLGGAGFPTAIKLAGEKPLHTLIINAAECEPYISADDLLMRERAEEIVLGIAVLMHISAAQQGLIGIEDNKPEAISALHHAIDKLALPQLQVVVIPTLYPSGGEKQLIKLLTGKEVPSGGIPADIGVLCQNVGTAAAIYNAVYLGEPLISRVTTVTGDAIARPANYQVLIGTPAAHVLTQAGYQPQLPERVIAGGPLMGFTLPNLNVPLTKTSNCLLAPTLAEIPLNDFAMECIRCGQCVSACPQELLPQQLYWFAKAQDYAKAEQHNLADCIECGACSYVCPSHIPLVQYYRHAKGEMRAEAAAAQKSEQARQRFENRNARIERLAAEREALRQARADAKAQAEAAAALADTEPTSTTPVEVSVVTPPSADDLEKKCLAQIDRVKKSQERYQAALDANLDTAPLLEQALQKQQEKLQLLEHELAAVHANTVKEA